MIIESWNKISLVASDGNYTIGYIDGKPAQWEGNMSSPVVGDDFELMSEDSIFGINSIRDYIVVDGEWLDL
jgi:hypothetical protein